MINFQINLQIRSNVNFKGLSFIKRWRAYDVDYSHSGMSKSIIFNTYCHFKEWSFVLILSRAILKDLLHASEQRHVLWPKIVAFLTCLASKIVLMQIWNSKYFSYCYSEEWWGTCFSHLQQHFNFGLDHHHLLSSTCTASMVDVCKNNSDDDDGINWPFMADIYRFINSTGSEL